MSIIYLQITIKYYAYIYISVSKYWNNNTKLFL